MLPACARETVKFELKIVPCVTLTCFNNNYTSGWICFGFWFQLPSTHSPSAANGGSEWDCGVLRTSKSRRSFRRTANIGVTGWSSSPDITAGLNNAEMSNSSTRVTGVMVNCQMPSAKHGSTEDVRVPKWTNLGEFHAVPLLPLFSPQVATAAYAVSWKVSWV